MASWLIPVGVVLFALLIMAGLAYSARAQSRLPRERHAIGMVYMNPRGPKHRPWTKGARLHTKDDLGRGNHKGLT